MILRTELARKLDLRPEDRSSSTYWDDGLSILGVRVRKGAPSLWIARTGIDSTYLALGPVDVIDYERAKRLAIERVRQDVEGVPQDPLVHDVLREYCDMKRGATKPSTDQARDRLRDQLLEVIPHPTCLSGVVRKSALDWRAKLSNRYGPSTGAKCMSMLRTVCRLEGAQWPTGVPTSYKRKRQPRVLTWAEWRSLWQALETRAREYPHGNRANNLKKSMFFQLLLLHPLRPWSELLPRRWVDYKEAPGLGRYLELDKRKSDHGRETNMKIILDSKAVDLLDRHNYSNANGSRTGYIFDSHLSDEPMSREALLRWFKGALKASRIEGKVIPKDLRHTAATRLAEANLDPTVQSALAGATIETLQRSYQRPSLEACFAAQDSLNYGQHLED